ncbi:hypothetical protein ACHWQZ_G009755 [Mnemiopsis leidyi]
MLPHGCVHGRTVQQWFILIPRSDNTCKEIVTNSVGHFCHCVSITGCYKHHVSPTSQLNVENFVADIVPRFPLVFVRVQFHRAWNCSWVEEVESSRSGNKFYRKLG